MEKKKVRYFLKGASILLLTIALILTSVVVTADKETMQPISKISYNGGNGQDIVWDNNIYGLPQAQNSINTSRGKFISVLRGWAVGNASSGKLIDSRGRMAKINFDFLKISRLRFFPIRMEMSSFWNVTAIFFGFDQAIPEGPFNFERDWVVAIVFKERIPPVYSERSER
jgi:hypothetical protein